MEDADETSINTNPPIYTYEVRTRSEDDIKRKRRQQKEKKKKKKKETLEHFVIKFVTKLNI